MQGMDNREIWLITNLTDELDSLGNVFERKVFTNYTFLFSNRLSHKGNWYCEGEFFYNNIYIKTSEAIERINSTQGNWIKESSGCFVLIQLLSDSFKIYSDAFGIKKFFYWHQQDKFIITNDMGVLANLVKLKPSLVNIARYAIHYHFTGGTTVFDGVYHNTPAQLINFTDEGLHFDKYWEPNKLLFKERKDVSVEQISFSLSQAVDQGLNLIGEERISLSLTGGADTRNLLALFLSKGLKPHLYTYGNPQSVDCVRSISIAKKLNLEHTVHDIQMTSELFEEYARKIVRDSGGMASLHRVHRLIAVEREREFADYMFLGTMGGEFVRGVSEDNYIIPNNVYENWNNPFLSQEKLQEYLQEKSIKNDNINFKQLLDDVNQEPFMQGNETMRKHNALSFITAHLHDAQDLNLYGGVMKQVLTPFLDMSYLKLLFSSPFSFNNKEKIPNKFLRRLENPIYAANFLNVTYPPLMQFQYSGSHKPSEVLFNKYYAGLIKTIRQKIGKTYPHNFPLGKWMVEFVEKNLPKCQDYPVLNSIFNIPQLLDELERAKHQTVEAYWLKFTNPIMMMYLIDEFC